MKRTVVLVLTLAIAMGGCSALTGRPFVQWTDDRAVTARVKTRLLAVQLSTVSRVHVDTYEGVVYLTGAVDSAETKTRTEAAVMAVEGVRHVVSHLITADSGRDVAPSALPAAALTRPVPAPLTGVARLDGHRAYDDGGRHVATVYRVPMETLAHDAAQRFDAARAVDHVTVHAMAADAGMTTPHYLVVLWHISRPPGP
jgi:hyperosmotically inducible periplasmic protein